MCIRYSQLNMCGNSGGLLLCYSLISGRCVMCQMRRRLGGGREDTASSPAHLLPACMPCLVNGCHLYILSSLSLPIPLPFLCVGRAVFLFSCLPKHHMHISLYGNKWKMCSIHDSETLPCYLLFCQILRAIALHHLLTFLPLVTACAAWQQQKKERKEGEHYITLVLR